MKWWEVFITISLRFPLQEWLRAVEWQGQVQREENDGNSRPSAHSLQLSHPPTAAHWPVCMKSPYGSFSPPDIKEENAGTLHGSAVFYTQRCAETTEVLCVQRRRAAIISFPCPHQKPKWFKTAIEQQNHFLATAPDLCIPLTKMALSFLAAIELKRLWCALMEE